MGCAGSKIAPKYQQLMKTPEFEKWSEMFEALQLRQDEVKQLLRLYGKVDLDGGGTIDVVELLTVIDVERTPFTERIFSIFDEDGSGKIDFGEFVLALWNYCTLSKYALALFAFDLYDRDSTGVLEDKDLELMLKDIYGKESKTNFYAKQVAKELEALQVEHNDIDVNVFMKYTTKHHSLLFPAFQMQLLLQTSIMGVKFWEKHGKRRIQLSNDKYIKIKDFLALVTDKNLKEINAQLVRTSAAKTILDQTGTRHDRMEKKNIQSLSELDKQYEFDFSSQATAGVKRRDPKMLDSYFHGTATTGGHGTGSNQGLSRAKGEQKGDKRDRRHTTA